MTNLLSVKLIVGISIFLLIVLFFITGQFNFDLPKIGSLDFSFNPFKDPCEGCAPTKRELMQNQKSWEDLTFGASDQYLAVLNQQKPMIDNTTDCGSLQGMYDRNTAWSIRPYIAHRILELNCVG